MAEDFEVDEDGPAGFTDEQLEELRRFLTGDDVTLTDGSWAIAAERQRQVEAEGWTPEHDDEHDSAELARAAHRYLTHAINQAGWNTAHFGALGWPWDHAWWKPSNDPIRNLVKAGALIAAEIDRLQRKAAG